MTHRSDTPVAVVLEELSSLGIEGQVIVGKHHKVRFFVEGRRRTYTVPKTTGDGRRTLKNCRAGIRRLLRQEGLLE